MRLINCENVSIKYENKVAVENVSFDINEGEYISIIGENGSGKSTLIKGILGLLKPSSGKVELCNLSRREIGYLPQQTQVQKDFPASVFEIVLSGFQGSAGLFYTKNQKQQAEEKMTQLGIGGLKKKSYMTLSGGQQQRVLLARALCSCKKLLVLDEPTTGLDSFITEYLYNFLCDLKNNSQTTIIMISHDVETAVKYSDKILQLDKKQLFFGSSEDYRKTDLYRKITGGKIQ